MTRVTRLADVRPAYGTLEALFRVRADEFGEQGQDGRLLRINFAACPPTMRSYVMIVMAVDPDVPAAFMVPIYLAPCPCRIIVPT